MFWLRNKKIKFRYTLLTKVLCAFFRYLARSYSLPHGIMAKPHESCDKMGNDVFYENDGITNGADWYAVAGGKLNTMLSSPEPKTPR